MAVHVVYRSYGGENTKDRPDYYSKLTALKSCLRAAQAAGVDVTFLNDGPIPADRLALMEASGTVVGSDASRGIRHSYRSALELAVHGDWADEDVVFFSEDDYLYSEDAFQVLQDFAEARPESTYYALYGFSGTPENFAKGIAEHELPDGWDPIEVVHDGRTWVQVDSTASTFGARLGALRQDLGIFLFCMVPHKNMLRDHDTMMLLQGAKPHRWGVLLRDLLLLQPGGVKDRVRAAGLAPFLIASNLRSHRRPVNRRRLLAVVPNVAAHLEVRLIPYGRDWAAEAAEAAQWTPDSSGHLSR